MVPRGVKITQFKEQSRTGVEPRMLLAGCVRLSNRKATSLAPASSAFCTSSIRMPGPSAYTSIMCFNRVVRDSLWPKASAVCKPSCMLSALDNTMRLRREATPMREATCSASPHTPVITCQRLQEGSTQVNFDELEQMRPGGAMVRKP